MVSGAWVVVAVGGGGVLGLVLVGGEGVGDGVVLGVCRGYCGRGLSGAVGSVDTGGMRAELRCEPLAMTSAMTMLTTSSTAAAAASQSHFGNCGRSGGPPGPAPAGAAGGGAIGADGDGAQG